MKKRELIILGGNTPNNIKWIKCMKKYYSEYYNVNIIYYDNWKNNTDINFDIESKKLIELTNNISNYIIIAKSAGVVLTVKNFSILKNKPKVIIAMGIPMLFSIKNNINLKNLLLNTNEKCKMLIIQQKYDPQCNFNELREILENKIVLYEIEGSSHVYANYQKIKLLIEKFLDQWFWKQIIGGIMEYKIRKYEKMIQGIVKTSF